MRVVPPDIASLGIYGSNRAARVAISRKNDEPPWPGRWPRGFVLELSGSASITRRAFFGDLRDGCVSAKWDRYRRRDFVLWTYPCEAAHLDSIVQK